jgi:predicted RNA-binding protein with EMAP domain
MDTANDFRILLAEKGLKELERLVNVVKVQRRKEIIKRVRELTNELQIVKYSYLSCDELLNFDSFQKIVKTAKDLREQLKQAERDFNWKQADYWLEYLTYLPELMKRGEITKAYEAIRFFSGVITNRQSINGLWFCNVDCGFKMNVVTNAEKFKPNDYVVIAYLPPREFKGYVSEGMFVDAKLEKKGELSLDEIKSIADKLGEVESILIELMK